MHLSLEIFLLLSSGYLFSAGCNTLLPVFRHLCLRADAFIAHVDEYLFVVGRGEFLHLRSHLSTLLHGFANPGHRTALPYAPLLYDLPDEHLQWFPDERCCAPLGRDGTLLCPANAHRLEHQEGNVSNDRDRKSVV